MNKTSCDSNQILSELIPKLTGVPRLEKMEDLDRAFAFPSRSFRSVHVAGTNGKGSVTTKIAKALTLQGYKTGLYTSPHISTFRERIKINGEMISTEAADVLLKHILQISMEVTFFEALTMMAFLYFQRQRVDFAIIETGLGGKYDATNVIRPELSVITNISFDHTQILGNTLDEIAENKAGIIKSETPVVLGSRATHKPILTKAFQLCAPVYIVKPVCDWMEENETIAKRALSVLSIPHTNSIPDVPSCRFEIIERNNSTYLFDIAHNPDAMEKLFNKLMRTFPNRGFSVVFSMSASKDVAATIQIIERHTRSIFPFDSGVQRLLRKQCLEELLGRRVEETLEEFISLAQVRGDVIVITGSAYIMQDAKTSLLP